MSQTERDLWPDEVRFESVVPPVVILREQAALLGEKTKGIVVGHVESTQRPVESVEDYVREAFGDLEPVAHTHTLYLVAPSLENYRYSLVSVSHDFEPYPCQSRFHPAPDEDFELVSRKTYSGVSSLDNEDEFVIWLQVALSRQETKRLIYALISRIEKTAQE